MAELKEKYESWRQGGVKGLAGRWKMAPEVGGRRSPGAAAWGGVAGWSRGRMLGAVQLKTARILLESKQAGTGAEVFECRMHYIGSDQTTTISPCPTCLQAAQPGGVVKIMYNRLSGPIVGSDIPPGQSLVLRVGEWVGVVATAGVLACCSVLACWWSAGHARRQATARAPTARSTSGRK